MKQSQRERLNKTRFDALRIDAQAGLTRARIASQAPARSDKRCRNQVNARRAYDSVLAFSSRMNLNPADARDITERLRRLKLALQELGEPLP